MGMIKLPKQSVDYFNKNSNEIFESGNLAEGPWNKKLSEYICDISGAKNAIPNNSNGAGLVALMRIYSYYFKRNKVLIQNNTMYGVKTMVPSGGCELLGYINCQLETLMPSLEDVKKSLSSFSKIEKGSLIILLSHIGGINNPDIEEIALLCKSENIVLLEDCAHSFGATLNSRHSGLFGDAGVYSFYATKAIPGGEGGCIVTNNDEIGQMAADFSIYDRFNQKMDVGFNNRVSELQALLLYAVTKEWQHIVDNKKQIANSYIKTCEELGIPYISQEANNNIGNYYKFTLYNHDNPTSKFLPSLITKTSPVYDYALGSEHKITTNHCCLPIWYGQEQEITQRVISELYESFAK